jgi:hypothetical protein
MAANTADTKAIFLDALERPLGAARAAYLDQACGADAERL